MNNILNSTGIVIFFTGVISLASSLGSIWLKERLKNKKSSKEIKNKKDLEAYSLLLDVKNAINPIMIAYLNLLKNKSFNWVEFLSTQPNNWSTYDCKIKQLELIIIGYFFDCFDVFLKIKNIIIKRYLNVYDLIENYDKKNYDKENDEYYINQMIEYSIELEKKLITHACKNNEIK